MKVYSSGQVALFMDSISGFYDIVNCPCSAQRISFLSKCISMVKSHNTFLDLSCSTGETIYQLSKTHNVIKFVGVDLSKGMIQCAKEKCRNKNNTHFICADMRHISELNIPIIDIAYSNSLEWLSSYDNIQKLLNSVLNILSPEGVMILDIVNEKKFNEKCKPYYGKYVKNGDVYFKNVIYEKHHTGKYYVNQTYIRLDAKNNEFYAYSGYLKYMPLEIIVLEKIFKHNGLKIIEMYNNYGESSNDTFQIVIQRER